MHSLEIRLINIIIIPTKARDYVFTGVGLSVCLSVCLSVYLFVCYHSWGLSAGYQPRPQVVDRGTTARYGGQLRYI